MADDDLDYLPVVVATTMSLMAQWQGETRRRHTFCDEPETISGSETPELRNCPVDSSRTAWCSSILS